MPCEIKELVINTSISESSSSEINSDLGFSSDTETYFRMLIKEEISMNRDKIINDCIDILNENKRLINQR
jgi:hypothetical protein|tara:strand:- start:10094 stop:10303 length:210 start_codon:yes stop_codon:yes gene_type:complete